MHLYNSDHGSVEYSCFLRHNRPSSTFLAWVISELSCTDSRSSPSSDGPCPYFPLKTMFLSWTACPDPHVSNLDPKRMKRDRSDEHYVYFLFTILLFLISSIIATTSWNTKKCGNTGQQNRTVQIKLYTDI